MGPGKGQRHTISGRKDNTKTPYKEPDLSYMMVAGIPSNMIRWVTVPEIGCMEIMQRNLEVAPQQSKALSSHPRGMTHSPAGLCRSANHITVVGTRDERDSDVSHAGQTRTMETKLGSSLPLSALFVQHEYAHSYQITETIQEEFRFLYSYRQDTEKCGQQAR
jgi:hypothetical protein